MSRTVVLTGASSFVGLHLGLAFAAAGWHVVAVHGRPRPTYDGIRARRLGLLADRAALIQADLTDGAAVTALVAGHRPDLWLQHAGYADNYAAPDYDLEAAHRVNVQALTPLYAALSGSGCGVIVTGSSMEYSAADAANREDDACLPDTPYGLSKLAETLWARQLAHRHGVPTRVARLYIPVGAFDNPAKLLPAAVAALAAGRPMALSACTQRRDFVAVEDVCDGYLRLAADMARAPFDVFNLCGGEAVALRDLLLGLAEAMGAPADLLRFGERPLRPGEPALSFGAVDKAATLLGWRPRPVRTMIRPWAATLSTEGRAA